MPTHDPPAPPRLLTRRALARRLGYSTRTLDRDRAEGRVPDPVRGNGKHPRWLESEVEAWIAAGLPDRVTWARLRAARKFR